MSTPAEQRLKELGLELPPAPRPGGVYVPAACHGDLLFTAGQIPMRDGQVAYRGRLGRDLTLEQGQEAARLCMLNALAVVRQELGSLDAVERVVQVRGFVQSDDSFHQQHLVMNAASSLLEDIFGPRGRHVRSALGTNTLPLDAAVEVELVVAVKGGTRP